MTVLTLLTFLNLLTPLTLPRFLNLLILPACIRTGFFTMERVMELTAASEKRLKLVCMVAQSLLGEDFESEAKTQAVRQTHNTT
jgi:hypothetical protein